MTFDREREFEARGLRHIFNAAWAKFAALALAVLAGAGAATVWNSFATAPQVASAAMIEPGAEEASGISFTPEQRAAVGIAVTPLRPTPLPSVFRAPGEVRTNDYTTAVVGPRISATVVSRSARLGESVARGQPLVTLYSMNMAEAQSAFLLAQRNLERFQSLQDIVAGQQIDEAMVKRQEARGRLESYGLTAAQIANLAARGLSNNAIGQFVLTAPQEGTITKDEFRVGEVVDAGSTLFEVATLQELWVEAQVSPALLPEMTGRNALVIAGNRTWEARLVQRRETVDETMRTVGVRLEVDNSDGFLKPGQFVDVELYGAPEPVLAVPTAAVQRNPDGDWAVYVERDDGSFAAQEVEVLHTAGDQTAISGIAEGTPIVTAGAFYVASEAAKLGFETHNH